MLRLNKKQGVGLIEVVCTIGVIALLLGVIMAAQLNIFKVRAYNTEKNRCLFALEALKEEIIHNYTYEDIRKLSLEDKIVVNKDQLTTDSIRELNLKDLTSDSAKNDKSYLVINIEDGFILKVQLELHILLDYKEEIYKYEFSKGNYI